MYPEVGLLDHTVVPFLIFLGTPIPFSIMALPDKYIEEVAPLKNQ